MAAECPDCGRERGLKNGDCDIGERYSPDGKLACLRLTVARLREQLADLEEKHERCLPENSKAWNDEMDRVTSRIDGREKIASLESELTAARAALAERDALSDRIITIADEGTGLHPVQSPDDALTRIERALFGYRAALAEKDAALQGLLAPGHGCNPEVGCKRCNAARRALSEHPPAPAPKEGK